MSPKNVLREEFDRLKDSSEPLHAFNVVTGSMEPLIKVGAKIIIDKTADYKINDIVVFWHANKLIVHVLWHINKNIMRQGNEILVTRALNSKHLDAAITRDQILGKVINYKLSFFDLIKLYLFTKVKRY